MEDTKKEIICVICQESGADDTNHFPCKCGVRFHKLCWEQFIERGIIYCPYCRKITEVRVQIPNIEIVPNNVPVVPPNNPNNSFNMFLQINRNPIGKDTIYRLIQVCLVLFCGLMIYEMIYSYNTEWYDFSMEVCLFFLTSLVLINVEMEIRKVQQRYIHFLNVGIFDFLFVIIIYCQILTYSGKIHNGFVVFVSVLLIVIFYFFMAIFIGCVLTGVLCGRGVNTFDLCFCVCRMFDREIDSCYMCGIPCFQ